jgi:hypothetical protein
MHFALLVQLIIPLVVRTVQPTIRYPVRAHALIWVASGKPNGVASQLANKENRHISQNHRQ